jgi:hypothetical protein
MYLPSFPSTLTTVADGVMPNACHLSDTACCHIPSKAGQPRSPGVSPEILGSCNCHTKTDHDSEREPTGSTPGRATRCDVQQQGRRPCRGEMHMYDAIVVGARCAGTPTAMLLARKGYRVLLLDRATFPSDILSTHYIHQPGVARLRSPGALFPSCS